MFLSQNIWALILLRGGGGGGNIALNFRFISFGVSFVTQNHWPKASRDKCIFWAFASFFTMHLLRLFFRKRHFNILVDLQTQYVVSSTFDVDQGKRWRESWKWRCWWWFESKEWNYDEADLWNMRIWCCYADTDGDSDADMMLLIRYCWYDDADMAMQIWWCWL